jgi:peptide/nickel transport system permease protein
MSATVTAAAPRPQLAPRRRRLLGPVAAAWQHGITRVGVVLTLAMVLLALVGPLLAPHGATDFVDVPFAGPGPDAPLGTDILGRDVLSQVLSGGRSLLWMAVAAAALGTATGIALGMVAGYSRNLLDDVVMRALDIVYAFPYIVLVLLFVALLGSQAWLIVLLVAIGWVPGVARTTRGVTLDVVTREYVEAAEVLGVPRRTILLREVLPNLATPLLVEFALRVTWSVGLIAALSFLGFGVQPPASDWGLMINENRNGMAVNPWSVLLPVGCVALFAIGTNLLADGIARSMAGIDRKLRPS